MDGATLIATLISDVEPSAKAREKSDRPAVVAPVEKLLPLMERLRADERFSFDMLVDHTAIDWVAEGRFELVYQLFSTLPGHSLRVTTSVPRNNPVAPTVCGLWETAQWQEREVFDLFGVLYDNHPDLRRLFLEDDWQGHPLRKDYQDDSMIPLPK